MKKVYLIRHGKRESQFEDTLLSQTGEKQAEITGEYFSEKEIKHIFASPLPRTQQTAKIISKILNLPIKTDDRLKERLLWGDREGETFEEFINEWDKASVERDYRPENGDSARMSGNRMKDVIDDTPDKSSSLIVAHSGIIGDYLMNFFPQDVLPFQKEVQNNVFNVEILECSITEIHIEESEVTLIRVNDASHLPQTLT